ncbi:MbtH family protein, partial [Streptomyces sp. URMC 126]
MSHPFESDDSAFLVLVNSEGQYSLWPEFIEVPDGWSVEWGPGDRETSVQYIEAQWTDMRPASLR